MSTVNPYSPPRSAVADIDGQDEAAVQPVRLWSWRGRVGRLRYLSYTMVAYLLMVVVAGLFGAIAGAFGGKDTSAGLVGMLAVIPYFVFVSFQTIQRSHDMDWSGWMSLLAFIPFAAFIWIFKAGTPGPNRFGAPPPPNTLGVKIGASLIPAVFVIGIVAAIALPAYQSYVQRAKAAQMK